MCYILCVFLNTSNPLWVTSYIMALYNNICILVRYAYYLNTSGYHVSGRLRGIFWSNDWFADQTLITRGRAGPGRGSLWKHAKWLFVWYSSLLSQACVFVYYVLQAFNVCKLYVNQCSNVTSDNVTYMIYFWKWLYMDIKFST